MEFTTKGIFNLASHRETYENVLALRAVITLELLAKVSTRIINEAPGANHVVYDVSSKSPTTIEWE